MWDDRHGIIYLTDINDQFINLQQHNSKNAFKTENSKSGESDT